MTYNQAVKQAAKIGASRSAGDPYLAQTCKVLAAAYPVSPQLLFDGAKKRGFDGNSLRKLAATDVVAFGDLMFA